MTNDSPSEEEQPMEPPQQYEKVKHTPLTEHDGWTVLSAASIAAGAIAFATLIAEVVTGGWLAQSLGLGIYMSTPLGVGATFLTVMVAKNRSLQHARIPTFFVIIYWALYLGSLLLA